MTFSERSIEEIYFYLRAGECIEDLEVYCMNYILDLYGRKMVKVVQLYELAERRQESPTMHEVLDYLDDLPNHLEYATL